MEKKEDVPEIMEFSDFISGHELEVRVDMIPKKGIEKPTGLEDCTQGYFLHEIDDPSVGIFGNSVSPSFYSMDELMKWTIENKEKILEQIGE